MSTQEYTIIAGNILRNQVYSMTRLYGFSSDGSRLSIRGSLMESYKNDEDFFTWIKTNMYDDSFLRKGVFKEPIKITNMSNEHSGGIPIFKELFNLDKRDREKKIAPQSQFYSKRFHL